MYLGARLELELVDPARNARRYYALAVIPDPQLPLFAGEPPRVVLVTLWGRLEGRRRVQRRAFASLEELGATWRAIVATRARHGYVVTTLALSPGCEKST